MQVVQPNIGKHVLPAIKEGIQAIGPFEIKKHFLGMWSACWCDTRLGYSRIIRMLEGCGKGFLTTAEYMQDGEDDFKITVISSIEINELIES